MTAVREKVLIVIYMYNLLESSMFVGYKVYISHVNTTREVGSVREDCHSSVRP